jgi:hypothetical protein
VIDVAGAEAATSNIEWQIQNEGMATYVAYRARPNTLKMQDYELLDNPSEVKLRFQLIRELLQLARRSTEADAPTIAKRSWADGTDRRGYYVVGGFMSRRIDEVRGRASLVATIKEGPKAFLNAYEETSPPDDLRLAPAQ